MSTDSMILDLAKQGQHDARLGDDWSAGMCAGMILASADSEGRSVAQHAVAQIKAVVENHWRLCGSVGWNRPHWFTYPRAYNERKPRKPH